MSLENLLFNLLLFLLTSLFHPSGPTIVSPTPVLGANQTIVKVTKVIDGDTIEIEGGQKVRLIGIDAPEKKGEECFNKESTKYLSDLILEKVVKLEKDVSETDRYGRLLRYIYLGDNFINKTMVYEGFAWSLTYPPDVKYSGDFMDAEKKARENNKGLWGKCRITN